MSRKTVSVDKDKLIEIIEKVETEENPTNRSALFSRVAELYGSEKVTASVVYLRVNQWGIPLKTPKGRKGGTVRSRKKKFDKSEHEHLDNWKKQVDKKYHATIDKIKNGSMKAAVKMKCLDCACWDKSEIKGCTVYECPLYSFRPYK